jgi:MYXO-CTERM domain-containing protein
MKLKALPFLVALSATAADAALISLNDVTSGSETVTLVANGGFELGTGNTNPTSWTRGGASFFDTDANAGLTASGFSNIPNIGKVAYYNTVVTGGNSNGQYFQAITGLDANTEYVFSAYLWNNSVSVFGSARNLVMDMNDLAGEAQLVFAGNTANAEDGYFASVNFNTSVTGTSFTIRVFGAPTDYTANDNTPIFAWDNVAITKAANFTSPVPEPSAALLGGIGLLALLRRRRN